MISSPVDYRGRGFWCYDGYLEDVLALLAQALGCSDVLIAIAKRLGAKSFQIP